MECERAVNHIPLREKNDSSGVFPLTGHNRNQTRGKFVKREATRKEQDDGTEECLFPKSWM